jgi:hypothetical protein
MKNKGLTFHISLQKKPLNQRYKLTIMQNNGFFISSA